MSTSPIFIRVTHTTTRLLASFLCDLDRMCFIECATLMNMGEVLIESSVLVNNFNTVFYRLQTHEFFFVMQKTDIPILSMKIPTVEYKRFKTHKKHDNDWIFRVFVYIVVSFLYTIFSVFHLCA